MNESKEQQDMKKEAYQAMLDGEIIQASDYRGSPPNHRAYFDKGRFMFASDKYKPALLSGYIYNLSNGFEIYQVNKSHEVCVAHEIIKADIEFKIETLNLKIKKDDARWEVLSMGRNAEEHANASNLDYLKNKLIKASHFLEQERKRQSDVK